MHKIIITNRNLNVIYEIRVYQRILGVDLTPAQVVYLMGKCWTKSSQIARYYHHHFIVHCVTLLPIKAKELS